MRRHSHPIRLKAHARGVMAWSSLRSDRAIDGARRLAHHSTARHRCLAEGVAGPEPARHPGLAWLRRRQAMARPAPEGPKWILSRRAARGAGVRGLDPAETRRSRKRKEEPSYQGRFTSARRHVLHTFAHTESALMKKRVSQYMLSTDCPVCLGKRLRGSRWPSPCSTLTSRRCPDCPLPATRLLRPYADGSETRLRKTKATHPERVVVAQRIASDFQERLSILLSWDWATCRSTAARRRSLQASCSGCAWRRRCVRISLESSTCSMNRRQDCTRSIPRPCSRRWID